MFSNAYIFRYSIIMVIIVAAVLSSAALLLQPYQDKNIRIEKMQSILTSVGIESTPVNAEELYNKYIVTEISVNTKGEEICIYTNGEFEVSDENKSRAFDIKIKEAFENANKGKESLLPVYKCVKDNQTSYIIPLYGKGLWGPIWGNIALKEDFKTVIGSTFGHKGETPGLGAEIDAPEFQNQFKNKTIFNENMDFTSIKVVKGGIGVMPEKEQIHGVDAISGGTITSNGVSDMLNDCLKNYTSYFKSKAL